MGNPFGGGGGGSGGLGKAVGTYAGGATYGIPGAIVGNAAGGGGSVQDISDRLAGMDPTMAHTSNFQAAPVNSNFVAQQAGEQAHDDFGQALRRTTYNGNLAFDGGAGPSFAQGLMGNYNQAQAQQQALMGNLQQQAMGQGPGAQLSNNFLHQAQDTNAANAMGLMASQKGVNPAMAARIAGNQAAMGNQQAAGQAANMNLQQALAAQGQLGGMLQQNQATNGNLFSGLTGQQNQNYGNVLQANQANNQMNTANFNHMQDLNQLTQSQNAANAMGAQGINAGTANANTAARTQASGGILGGLGSMGAVAMALSHGGRVPGESSHNGDDTKNDTVHTMLSPGEIVIPRSASTDRDKAMKFLDALKSGDSTWQSSKPAKGKKK